MPVSLSRYGIHALGLVIDSILQLLDQYGAVVYLLLFGYCALKSGWLPLFAGYAAFLGALDVALVALAAFAGGYLGDELRFAAARAYGVRWVSGSSRLSRLFQRASSLAERHGKAYIFLYRYPKGLRTIGALPIGLTTMRWPQFTCLNAASAAVWVLVLVGGGYAFGASFDALGAGPLTAVSILLLVMFLLALTRLWRNSPIQEHQPAAENRTDSTAFEGQAAKG